MKRTVQIIDFNDERASNAVLRNVAKAKGRHYVCLEPVRSIRSLKANSYYWGIVLPYVSPIISELYGESFTDEEAHELLKRTFLPSREVTNHETGETVELTSTTTNKDSKEFAEYVDKIILFCAENGVAVPDSDGNTKTNPTTCTGGGSRRPLGE